MVVQEAIILAGGLGTRLKDTIGDIPKAMALVNGKPFLEYVFDYLYDQMIDHVVLSVGYKHELIKNYFRTKYKSIDIHYATETEPLGTGGAITNALKYISGMKTLVFNGDTLFRINLDRLFEFHFSKSSEFSVVLRLLNDVSRYGAVERNENHRIINFVEKGEKRGEGMINGGVYLINKKFFEKHPFPEKFSIEKDCLEKFYHEIPFYGLVCRQYFIDIGVPEDYLKAQDEFKRFNY
jgi:D-glycero-alpha-D-manno-heptose 1-phosphate guanylyltransferase